MSSGGIFLLTWANLVHNVRQGRGRRNTILDISWCLCYNTPSPYHGGVTADGRGRSQLNTAAAVSSTPIPSRLLSKGGEAMNFLTVTLHWLGLVFTLRVRKEKNRHSGEAAVLRKTKR